MSTTLLPLAPRISLVDQNGNMTRPWSLYFQDVFLRIGGSIAPTPGEIVTMVLASIAANQPQNDESDAINIQITHQTVQQTAITLIMTIEEHYDDPVYIPLR